MKKFYLLSLALITAFAISSCSKDDSPSGDNNNQGGNEDKVPTEFTKKVLVEEFSGAWCGWCPDGAYRLEQMIDENPNQIIGVTLHYGDAMQITNYDDIKNKFGVSGYPSGMVDRRPSNEDQKVAMNRGYWKSNASARMNVETKTGLKIDATNSDKIKVTVGFNDAIDGDVRLTVYALEDNVTGSGSGYNQQNYLSNRNGYQNNPYYKEPSVIIGYKHMKTWRKVLTDDTFGEAIPSADIAAGSKYEQTFSIAGNSWNESNVNIVAFVNVVGKTSTDHEVLNAQKVKLGYTQGWD